MVIMEPVDEAQRQKNAARVLERVSPSQIESFEMCPRRWYNQSILGMREPGTPAQQRGIDVASAVEKFYEAGELPPPEFPHLELVRAILPHLGPRTSTVSVEKWVESQTAPGLPNVRGRYDHFDREERDHSVEGLPPVEAATLSDVKCRSSARYAKTPAELANDLQLNSYAVALVRDHELPRIALRHVYGITSGKPKAFPVSVVLEPEQLLGRWNKTVSSVRTMATWANLQPADASALDPNTEACSKFPPAGCPFRSRCGFTSNPFQIRRPEMSDAPNASSDLMRRLQEQTAKLMGKPAPEAPAAAPAPAPPQALAAVPPPGITKAAAIDPVQVVRDQLASRAIVWDSGAKQLYAKEGADSGWTIRQPTIVEQIAIDELELAKKQLQTSAAVPPSDPAKNTTAVKDEGPAIVPPDAPPRTNPPVEAAAPVVEKAKRARKPKAEPEMKITVTCDGCGLKYDSKDSHACAEEEQQAREVVAAAAITPGSPARTESFHGEVQKVAAGPVLYINCVPTKGEHNGLGLHFEEWMAPIMEELCKEKSVVDYRLIQYTAKGDLAAKVRLYAPTLKGAVVLVSRFSPSADVFLEAITPHASQIVQGV